MEESAFEAPFLNFLFREFSELRRRVIWCAFSLMVVAGLLIGLPSWEHSYVMRIAQFAQGQLLPNGIHLIFLDPLEAMLVMFKLSLLLAVAVCSPILAYHFVAFTSPALDKGYRFFYVKFVAAAVTLFGLGLCLTYFFFLPLTVKMLLNYGIAAGGAPQLSFDRFYSFVFLFLLVFSLPFETPLIIGFLHHFNLIPASSFKAMRLKVYGALLIISQFLTPDPIITPSIFVVMCILLYEAGILCCRWL